MSAPAKFVEFWGPSTWKALHSIAYTAPVSPTIEQQREYVDFFRALGPVLPCPSCSLHYQTHLGEHPVDASSREALVRWVYDLHDSVNRRKGKVSPPRAAVDEHYAGWSAARHAKLAASGRADLALGSSRIEEATAEEARAEVAVLVVLGALLLAAGVFLYLRRRRAA
jgi:LPXTG-motif cell wall-anchored protein